MSDSDSMSEQPVSPVISTTQQSSRFARPIALCLDALVCTCAPYQHSLRTLWNRGGLHPRFESLARWLERHAPRLTQRLTRAVLRDVEINARQRHVEPMDRGRAVTVFRLGNKAISPETPGQSQVLKVYRSSLGLRGKKLIALIANIQLGIDQLERWYGNCEGLLVPIRFLRIRGPILGIHALVLEQALINTNAKDFFRDYTDDQLLTMLRDDNTLLEQFNGFVEGTRVALDEGTRCFDMHGEKNLSVITTPKGQRLCIVDYGVYDLAERKHKAPDAYAEILQFHDRLFALHNQLGSLRN